MNTISTFIVGLDAVQTIVSQLVNASAWFEYEPYPEDEYKITVKPENRDLLFLE